MKGRYRIVSRQARCLGTGYKRQLGARVGGVKDIVLDEFKTAAVILTASALGYHIDRGGSGAPKLGVIVRSLYRYFLNEIDPHFIENAIVRASVKVPSPIYAPVLPIEPLAVNVGDGVVISAGYASGA